MVPSVLSRVRPLARTRGDKFRRTLLVAPQTMAEPSSQTFISGDPILQKFSANTRLPLVSILRETHFLYMAAVRLWFLVPSKPPIRKRRPIRAMPWHRFLSEQPPAPRAEILWHP